MPKYQNKTVLIASANTDTVRALSECLRSQYDIVTATNENKCLELFRQKRNEYNFIDIELFGNRAESNAYQKYYKAVFKSYFQHYPTAEIIIITKIENIRKAVFAVKAGASDYIAEPINIDEVKLVTQRIRDDIMVQEELDYLRDQFWEKDFVEVIQTKSPLMKEVLNKIRSVATTKTTVLLQGETGTGKGVMARLIHAHSNRKNNQFISVHCGAIPDTLIESELFGHEKGAFTGADRRKLGKFAIAQEGTLFLDEISTITPATQIKLLQVLQDKTIQPIGGEVEIETDVRFVAATNADLRILAEAGNFRKDLYYRLNVFPIELPPLKDRKEDIPNLISLFLKRLNQFHGKEINEIHPAVLEGLSQYEWPGNIRELENLIERAYILESSNVLSPESFPGELFQKNKPFAQIHVNASKKLSDIRKIGVENIERQYLKEVLSMNKGRIDKSAGDAGISTRQLHKLLHKYGINKEEFKK